MPKQRTRAKGFLIGIVVLTGMMVVSQYLETRRPPAEQEAIVARGRVLYASLCQECHGARMEGGRIPATGQDVSPLTGTALRVYFRVMPEGTENWIAGVIANGSGAGAMPGFAGKLSEPDQQSSAVLIHAVDVGDARMP